jgi:alpha-L-fucosidase
MSSLRNTLLVFSLTLGSGRFLIAAEPPPHPQEPPPNPALYSKLTAEANKLNETPEPVADGPFKPDWDSLKQYKFPDWFRDAKFGIWAHWGPQCQPEEGDWYARNMYSEYNKKGQLNGDYVYHQAHYGHQTVFGFKDIIPLWTAANWDPEKLLQLYKKAGAKYFMALANHHDNMDTWDSKYQPWNAVNLGPKKDLIAGWSKAAKDAGLYFGVSVHAARAWGWNDGTLHSDSDGPHKGEVYDGRLTAADGKGLWWEGLDPQDLYAQNHGPKDKPSKAYMQKFFNRTMDLINRYHPDMLYFDDDISGGLPLYNDDPTVGLRIAAHFYNTNAALHGGQEQAIIAAKKLTLDRRKVLLYDIERGASDKILPEPWETDTCIGQWHYSKELGARNGYKKCPDVVRMLADIVSKNGNLMLSVPVRADGTLDNNELEFLKEMGDWMSVNGEGIYATRPWAIYGEGPGAQAEAAYVASGEVVEKKPAVPLGADDIRFTTSKDGSILYAIVLGWPSKPDVTIKSLATGSTLYPAKVAGVELLGGAAKPEFTQDSTGLHVTLPKEMPGSWASNAIVLKITK